MAMDIPAGIDIGQFGFYAFITYIILDKVVAPLIKTLAAKKEETSRRPWEERLYAAIEANSKDVHHLAGAVKELAQATKENQVLYNNMMMTQIQRDSRAENQLDNLKATLARIEKQVEDLRHGGAS